MPIGNDDRLLVEAGPDGRLGDTSIYLCESSPPICEPVAAAPGVDYSITDVE